MSRPYWVSKRSQGLQIWAVGYVMDRRPRELRALNCCCWILGSYGQVKLNERGLARKIAEEGSSIVLVLEASC